MTLRRGTRRPSACGRSSRPRAPARRPSSRWRCSTNRGSASQRIVMLEPRRLATRAAARRMASTTRTAVGDLVGYQTRDERHIGRGDPHRGRHRGRPDAPPAERPRASRSRHRDLRRGPRTQPHDRPRAGTGPRRRLDDPTRPTDPGDVGDAGRRGSDQAPRRAGRREPGPHVRRRDALGAGRLHRRSGAVERVGPSCNDRGPASSPRSSPPCCERLREQTGDVLVFLPGIGEIRRTEAQLADVVGPDVDVFPLAGALTPRRTGPGARTVATGTTAGRALHRHRRDVADRRRGSRGGRQRARSGAALRRPDRDDPAHHRVDEPGIGRTTRRARRAHRAGRRLPAVEQDRARQPTCAPVARDHPGRSRRVRARARGVGRWATTSGSSTSRLAGALAQARELLARPVRARRRRLDHPARSHHARPAGPSSTRPHGRRRPVLAGVRGRNAWSRSATSSAGAPTTSRRTSRCASPCSAGRDRHDAADRGAVHRLRERAADLARRAGIPFDLDARRSRSRRRRPPARLPRPAGRTPAPRPVPAPLGRRAPGCPTTTRSPTRSSSSPPISTAIVTAPASGSPPPSTPTR